MDDEDEVKEQNKTFGTDAAVDMLLEALSASFGKISEKTKKDIKSIKQLNVLKTLLRSLFDGIDLKTFNQRLKQAISQGIGKYGLDYYHNYDVTMKWIANRFVGKTLAFFGVQSDSVCEVFQFEPIEFPIKAGRLDVIFKDNAKDHFHIEFQRNMTLDDLHRFASHHIPVQM